MILHYFDPSAWVKRYFQESGSDAVNELFRGSLSAACCRLGLVEMMATVARKGPQESLDAPILERLFENVAADFAEFQVVPIDEARIVEATALAKRYRLRTMDAIHLACALSLRPSSEIILVSGDLELLIAATHEGLSAVNPSTLS